jgi:hypothetical protein
MKLALLAAACGGTSWYVTAPKQVDSVPLDSYVSFQVFADHGGIEPAPLATISRCVDPTICVTRVSADATHVDVVANNVGSTQLLIDVIAPAYVPHDRIAIPVTITKPPPRPLLAVGAVVPRGAATFDDAHCVALPRTYESIYGPRDLALFTCAVADSDGRFLTCDGSIPCFLSFTVCAETRDNVVTGLRVLVDHHRVTRSDGALQGRNCEPRL